MELPSFHWNHLILNQLALLCWNLSLHLPVWAPQKSSIHQHVQYLWTTDSATLIHSNDTAWTSLLEPVGISVPAAASLSAEVPFWTGCCPSETFTGYRQTFGSVTASFAGKPSKCCLSSCTDLCPWQQERLFTTKNPPEKYWLCLAYISKGASTAWSWTPALLVTQISPQKKIWTGHRCSPSFLHFRSPGIKPGFCFQDARAPISSPHEAKWVDLYIKPGGTQGWPHGLWHVFSWALSSI